MSSIKNGKGKEQPVYLLESQGAALSFTINKNLNGELDLLFTLLQRIQSGIRHGRTERESKHQLTLFKTL